MKNVIGTVRMYPSSKSMRDLRLYFPRKIVEILGDSIVFNVDKMKIRRATIDDTKTLRIANLHSSIAVDDPTSYFGKYDLLQKNEDTFKLKKVKDGEGRLGKRKQSS